MLCSEQILSALTTVIITTDLSAAVSRLNAIVQVYAITSNYDVLVFAAAMELVKLIGGQFNIDCFLKIYVEKNPLCPTEFP